MGKRLDQLKEALEKEGHGFEQGIMCDIPLNFLDVCDELTLEALRWSKDQRSTLPEHICADLKSLSAIPDRHGERALCRYLVTLCWTLHSAVAEAGQDTERLW